MRKQMTQHREISVVIPVYGCEGSLRTLHEQLTATLRSITPDYEIILIDDHSVDGSWDTVSAIAAGDPAVRAFRLSRNFGQQAAIVAGMAKSRGQWTAVMDCDLQDPPDVVADLYAKAREGFDVVYGVRKRRGGTPPFRRFLAAARARTLEVMAGIEIDTGHGCMTLMSRPVVDGYLSVPDRERDHILILQWLGFDSASVDYEQARRHSGKSSYSPQKLISIALAGMFFQTTKLLHWIVYTGFMFAGAGAILGLYLLIARIVQDDPAPGWTSLALILLLFGGFIVTSTGITGLYIGRVFEQVKGRPLYVIQHSIEDPEERMDDLAAIDAPPAQPEEFGQPVRPS
jgi:glycosyltransferase involved in cell wall biosynthesis